MPVVKKPGTKNCYKVANTASPKACLTKGQAQRQERAINANRTR